MVRLGVSEAVNSELTCTPTRSRLVVSSAAALRSSVPFEDSCSLDCVSATESLCEEPIEMFSASFESGTASSVGTSATAGLRLPATISARSPVPSPSVSRDRGEDAARAPPAPVISARS